MHGHHHDPSAFETYFFAALLIGMVLALAFEEKIHAKKSVITGVTAVVALTAGAIFENLPDAIGHLPTYVLGIDWEVIAIILGASLFVDVSSKSGIFSWLAIRLTRVSGGDPVKLLIFYGVMTVFFSAVLNNVTAMIIVGSLTVVSLEKLERRHQLLGFLVTEALLTNIGGLLTLISSVPNIIVGNTAGIEYVPFFLRAAPFVLVATAVTLLMATVLFKIKPLRNEEDKRKARALVESFDPTEAVTSKGFFIFATLMFIAFVLTLSTTSFIPYIQDLGMGFVAMGFGIAMLIKVKSSADKQYANLDWDLLFFFATLFVVIDVMGHAGVLKLLGKGIFFLIGDGGPVGSGLLLVASAVTSSVTDNIPLAAMLAKILAEAETAGDSQLWWSVIFGANLGGNFSPIGSASTVVGMTVMHKHGIELGFVGFIKTAIPFALVHVAMAVVYVLVFL